MTIRAFLAAAALTTSFAGVAGAQQPPQEGYEPPQQGYEQPPQQGYAQPPQQYAPPPGYAAPPEGTPPAPAPAAIGLGAVGQIAISDDLLVTISRSSQSIPNSTSSKTTSIQLQPALDYFVAPNLSIGGQLRLGVSSNDGGDATTIGLLPRIGYNIPIGPTASIWPRASLAYVHYSSSVSGGGYSTSSYTVSFIAFVPVLFQPTTHFFIGGGPFLSTDLISKYEAGGVSADSIKTTEFGLLSTVGGYFGGT
jgi:hypothetical protein